MTSTNSLAIARCFDQAANTYDEHAHIQQRTCHYLLHLLPNHRANSIIDLGCGTGFSTRALHQHFPASTLNGIDISERSLLQAQRLHPSGHYQLNDFNHPASYPHSYELIFANMALQWSDDLSTTLQLLRTRLSNKAILAFSLPLQGTFNNLKPCDIHQLATDNDVQQALTNSSLHCIDYRVTTWHQPYRSLLHALRAIKATGANFTASKVVNRHCRQWLRNQLRKSTMQPFNLPYHLGFYLARPA